ncbi:MAG: class I SAM-dependent methyltransferase [Chloroflexi bacterium]|nr:class I SAM-dependent methyltransferase [Chloroflexota bacterium]
MVKVNCNLCGRDDWQVLLPSTLPKNGRIEVDAFRCTSSGYGFHAQIVTCNHCGYVYANPRWSENELLGAYESVEDETYVSERQGREITFSRHLKDLEKYVGVGNGRSLLDVGAYIGVFVEIAAKAGWKALGIEPSEWAAKQAQKQGVNVMYGTQDSPALQPSHFDVITMWDVIEHVDDPSGEMTKAFNLLKPGGFLVLHTMDIDSLAARVMKSRWPWFMDMHIHYFSQRTMKAMLEKNGFEVVEHGVRGRYLTLNYLATRVSAFNKPLGKMAAAIVKTLRLGKVAVPFHFGDLFTAYARRPLNSEL